MAQVAARARRLGPLPPRPDQRDNVGDLRMVSSRALGPGRQQGTPLVRDGVMFIQNPQDVIQAIDAVTGDLVWKYCRDRPDDLGEYRIDTLMETRRNVAIHGELIFDTTMDDIIVALDGETAEVVWDTRTVRSSPTEYSAPHLRISFQRLPDRHGGDDNKSSTVAGNRDRAGS